MLFKFFVVLLVASIPVKVLSAQEPQSTSVEEKVLQQSFAGYQAGLAYDEVCNGNDPKSRYDFSKPENVYLMGSQNLLAGRIGGLLRLRFPESTQEELVERMLQTAKAMNQSAASALKEHGCESDAGVSASRSWTLYTKVHPMQISTFIDKAIVDQGGAVTTFDDE